MKTKTLGAFALAGTLLGLLAGAGPSSAAPAKISKSAVSGEAVFGSFRQSTECIRTQASVFASVNDNGEKLASLTLVVVDTCAQEILVEGFGTTHQVDLESTPNLDSGRMSATIPFTNVVNGSVTAVPIDMSLVATDSRATTATGGTSRTDDLFFQSIVLSKVRQAQAAATFSFGSLFSFVDQPSFEASIANGSERTITKEAAVSAP